MMVKCDFRKCIPVTSVSFFNLDPVNTMRPDSSSKVTRSLSLMYFGRGGGMAIQFYANQQIWSDHIHRFVYVFYDNVVVENCPHLLRDVVKDIWLKRHFYVDSSNDKAYLALLDIQDFVDVFWVSWRRQSWVNGISKKPNGFLALCI